MKNTKKKLFKLILGTFVLLLSQVPLASAANIYVDKTLSANCTTGNYSTTNRLCNGSNGNAYTTVQAAVNACSIGDVIHIRSGTYIESINIPGSKNGSAWTAGNFTTLQSYPGEWAVLQSPNASSSTIYHVTGPSKSGSLPTKYWKFERLEITGGRFGILLDQGPVWIRHTYIHDNNYSGICDDLTAGIWINQATQNIIEYNWIANNMATGTSSPNCANVGFDSDYRDDEAPTTFNPDLSTNRNEVRYNLFEGSQTSLTHKNQQRFGTNTRVPTEVSSGAYKDWGDKWHHNIVRNFGSNGIKPDQDNAQVYNNIVVMDTQETQRQAIQFGREDGLSSHSPLLYNAMVYNNTVINSNKGLGYFSGNQTTSWHGYAWFYNNIIEQNKSTGWQEFPFVIAADITTGYYANITDTFIKNNIIHSPSWNTGLSPYVFLRGRADYYTLDNAQTAFPSISGNWQKTSSGLFQGSAGESKYISSANFAIGSTTIANGGIGGAHPYLTGVKLPSYVGATDPNDNAWVAGVLGLSNTETLKAGGKGGPSWVTSVPKLTIE